MFGKHWRQTSSARSSFFLRLSCCSFPDNKMDKIHFQVGSDVRTVPECKLHPICVTIIFTSLLCSSALLTNKRMGQKQQE